MMKYQPGMMNNCSVGFCLVQAVSSPPVTRIGLVTVVIRKEQRKSRGEG